MPHLTGHFTRNRPESASGLFIVAMHISSRKSTENSDVVKLLLNHGAEAKAAGNDGWTVLHSEALDGHEPWSNPTLDHGTEAKAAVPRVEGTLAGTAI
jgi:hypothetical protein